MTVLVMLGDGGGICTLLGGIVIMARGIFRQVTATEENTGAVQDLTRKVEDLMHGFNGHEKRIAILEDRTKR